MLYTSPVITFNVDPGRSINDEFRRGGSLKGGLKGSESFFFEKKVRPFFFVWLFLKVTTDSLLFHVESFIFIFPPL